MTAEFHRMTDTNFKAAVQLILQASMDGKPKHEAVLSLGATPQFLLDNGFPELPLSIKGAVIDKAHFDHGITRGVLERLARSSRHQRRSTSRPRCKVLLWSSPSR